MKEERKTDRKLFTNDLEVYFTIDIKEILLDVEIKCRMSFKNGVTKFEVLGSNPPLDLKQITFIVQKASWRV